MSGTGYAVVVEIAVASGSDPAHRGGVRDDFVVPELRSLPGYRKSLWLNGDGTGTCLILFDEPEQARAGLEVLTRPGGPPALRAGIHEVELEDPPPGSA